MPPRKRKIPNQDPEARTKHKHDKPKNLEQAIVCANDDFETQPRKKLKIMAKDPKKGKIVVKGESSNPAQIRRVQRVKDYPVLINRTTTLSLVDSIQKLNDRQRKAVREIGFENILELNIKELPLRLAYWVVDNFDSRDCQLSLKKRRSLQIEEEDVYRIFRFPRGTQKIEPKKNERTKNEVLEQWYGFFENRYKIVSPMLAEELLKHEDGGIWFKRHFVILLIVSLIANTSDGYIHPFIMHHLIDVDNLKNLNWAQYLISCLVDRKSAWETKKQAFGGPTLFLTLFYLDRVKFKSMTVSRSYPICVNWNYIKIKERELKEIEAGGFGFGLPCEPITCTETDVIDQDAAEQQPKSTPILEGCVTELLQDAREIANKLVKFVTKLEKAPVEAFDDINFRRTMENAHQMIGYNISEKYKDLEAGPSEIRESQLDNAFWQQPEVIKAFDEIVDAVFKRKEYIDNLDNGPNFKLGISQMFPPSQEDDDPQGTKENEPKDNQVNDDDMVIADQDYILSTPTSPQMREHEVHDQVQQKNIEVVVKEGDQYSKEKDNEKSDEDEGDEAEENEESETEKEKEYTEEDVLFKCGQVELRRRELMTLNHGNLITISVIDIWSIILNANEGLRSPNSPSRFFATTDPCLRPITVPPETWTIERRRSLFDEKLQEEIGKHKFADLQDIDLFFFPIYKSGHYFIICIDARIGRAIILDNINHKKENCDIQKYTTIAEPLVDFMAHFLEKRKLTTKARKLRKPGYTVLMMPWADPNNFIDCGIYIMRHMETYMGQKNNKWRPGFSKTSKKQMGKFRVKYCAYILNADCNELNNQNLTEAHLYYNRKRKDRNISLADILFP